MVMSLNIIIKKMAVTILYKTEYLNKCMPCENKYCIIILNKYVEFLNMKKKHTKMCKYEEKRKVQRRRRNVKYLNKLCSQYIIYGKM